MERKLKNCYRNMDLPFTATIKDVEMRRNAMIKTLGADGSNKTDKKILKIENTSNIIIANIKNNGIPTEEDHCFESSKESIFGLLIVLFFVSLICYFSFYFL